MNIDNQVGQFKRCMLHLIKKNINKKKEETEMNILTKVSKLMAVLIFALTFSLVTPAIGGQKSVSRSHTTTVSKYGRSSYSARSSDGVKVNTSPYGRSSYIQRTYSKNNSLQSTKVITPYGNGWIIR